jgi:ABC-type polysaccharide/polyol phosphate transport system ATPase subunit
MGDDISIINLSESFSIRYNRASSLKSMFVGMFHKRYRERVETFWGLREINLMIHAGEAFGVIGRNGSGKSTLLRIIAGIYPPSSGEITIPKNARVGTMIGLGAGFHPELTGRENLFWELQYMGLAAERSKRCIRTSLISRNCTISWIPLLKLLIGNARFALAIQLNPSIIIIDGVLAVGDEEFQKKSFKRLRGFKTEGKTIIFVSHDLSAVAAFCDRVCVLDHDEQMYLGRPKRL